MLPADADVPYWRREEYERALDERKERRRRERRSEHGGREDRRGRDGGSKSSHALVKASKPYRIADRPSSGSRERDGARSPIERDPARGRDVVRRAGGYMAWDPKAGKANQGMLRGRAWEKGTEAKGMLTGERE